MPLYDEVEIEDMKWDGEQQCFTYECPCGDLFFITLEELRNGEEIAKCPSCTLFVQVIYNQASMNNKKVLTLYYVEVLHTASK